VIAAIITEISYTKPLHKWRMIPIVLDNAKWRILKVSKIDNKSSDVIIIGGGVVGLSIARELGKRGLEVTILERSSPGRESSFAAAGMLTSQSWMDKNDSFFKFLIAGRDQYRDFAQTLYEETGIDIELDPTGTLNLALTNQDETDLERRYQWQKEAGFSVEKLSADETLRLEPRVSADVRWSLLFPMDTQIENRRLITALLSAIEKYRVKLLTGTEVISLDIEESRIKGVKSSRGLLSAAIIIIAAGAWSSLLGSNSSLLQIPRIEPVRGQMLCFEARPQLTRHVIHTARGYIVPRRDGRLLVGSTTEYVGYEKAVTGQGIHSIISEALDIAPSIGDLRLKDAYSGLRPSSTDELPVIGKYHGIDNLYLATGHFRDGILLAPLTGSLMADLVIDKTENQMLVDFSVERFRKI
jgi:glycine oxidase